MHLLIRVLVAVLLGLWLASPSVGGDGGENAGGTGVWILPRCAALPSGPCLGAQGSSQYSRTFQGFNQDLSLVGSSECGQIVAVLVDPASGVPMALPVLGRNAAIPAAVLQGLVAAGVSDSQIVMMDAARQGYVIHVRLDFAANTVTLRL